MVACGLKPEDERHEEVAMSVEDARALLERVKSDEEFRKELDAAPTPEERSRIVKDAGFDVSDDDVKRTRTELSDEDLEKVAGGDVGYDVWIGPLGTH